MRNYYDLLAIDAAASVDDVNKAFKHEIAKYRPDKVQHLGQEFQAMASALAADLTEAYRILVDPELRANIRRKICACAVRLPSRPRCSGPPRHRRIERSGTSHRARHIRPEPRRLPNGLARRLPFRCRSRETRSQSFDKP